MTPPPPPPQKPSRDLSNLSNQRRHSRHRAHHRFLSLHHHLLSQKHNPPCSPPPSAPATPSSSSSERGHGPPVSRHCEHDDTDIATEEGANELRVADLISEITADAADTITQQHRKHTAAEKRSTQYRAGDRCARSMRGTVTSHRWRLLLVKDFDLHRATRRRQHRPPSPRRAAMPVFLLFAVFPRCVLRP